MKDEFDFDGMSFSDMIKDETEFIPLLTSEEDGNVKAEDIPDILPILSLRNTVLFPGVVIPITVGRDKSIKLIQEAYKNDRIIGVVAQKDDKVEDPGLKDLNMVGTVAYLLKMLRMPDGNTTVIIQGKRRFEIKEVYQEDPYIKAAINLLPDALPKKQDKRFDALIGSLKDLALQIITKSPNIPSEASFAIKNIESPAFLINFISSNMNIEVSIKQKILETSNIRERASLALEHLTNELQMLELKNQIQSKVKTDIDQQQREYFLHQQLKTIQEELGGSSFEQEIDEFRDRAAKKKWNKKVAETFENEVSKLQRMNPASAEYSVQLNYVEMLLELPWESYTRDNFDLKRAQKILDKDHFGLEDVKERIIEYLAVLKLKKDMKSPILCFVGPPGVGKTSLGKSIARALGRKYVRVSLGGLKDEAEIRGHRKTYIGAMPGRILQNIKKASSSNPVFVLDEIDKVGSDFHGDPSSALLEVLDPEQNDAFYDNYVELEYDLSKVMFIATANTLSTIQPALRDRMEIIQISGYTLEEKIEIAKRHLINKQLEEHGMKKGQVLFDKKILKQIIEGYTRESGVRSLERKIAKVIRHCAKSIAMGEEYNKRVSTKDVIAVLGAPDFLYEKFEEHGVAGVVTGLAWTSTGGDILYIESSLSKGKGKLTMTGNLGDVMKESATIAQEYIKSHYERLDIAPEVFEHWNIHIHVPEGATPKDGPSAGIAMLTAMASAYTQRKVKSKLAMTGEITLRGKVLPVGGIKEKILAAKRAGVEEIILCERNKKDVDEIKKDYIQDLKFHYVSTMEDVLDVALMKEKVEEPLHLI